MKKEIKLIYKKMVKEYGLNVPVSEDNFRNSS